MFFLSRLEKQHVPAMSYGKKKLFSLGVYLFLFSLRTVTCSVCSVAPGVSHTPLDVTHDV